MVENNLHSNQNIGLITSHFTVLQLFRVLGDTPTVRPRSWVSEGCIDVYIYIVYCVFEKAFDKVPHNACLPN